MMDRTSRGRSNEDGFEVQSTLVAGTNNSEHTHPFDARLYVLSGNSQLGAGQRHNLWSGTCSMDADTLHTGVVN